MTNSKRGSKRISIDTNIRAKPSPPTPPLEHTKDEVEDQDDYFQHATVPPNTSIGSPRERRSSIISKDTACSPSLKSVSFQLPNGQITSPIKEVSSHQLWQDADDIPKQIPLKVIGGVPPSPPTQSSEQESEFIVPLFDRPDECKHLLSHGNNKRLLDLLKAALGEDDFAKLGSLMTTVDRSGMSDREWIQACNRLVEPRGACYWQGWKELVGVNGEDC